jgi:hypothetical protein
MESFIGTSVLGLGQKLAGSAPLFIVQLPVITVSGIGGFTKVKVPDKVPSLKFNLVALMINVPPLAVVSHSNKP